VPGLYLPKSHHDHQQRKQAELVADWYTKNTPDFGDAMELQRRLQLRDARLSVVWGQAGPHMNRWVILRTAEDGQQHVVKVFNGPNGQYDRPEPSVGDNLMDISGSAGYQLLREMEAREQKEREDAAKYRQEFVDDLGERLASTIVNSHGIKDNILVTKDVPK
jgi:hypothetical protein